MSWAPPSGGRSQAPDRGGLDPQSEFNIASLVRLRGASLVDALEDHLPGSREHAEATASYAFAIAVELGHDRSHAELVREAAKLHDVGKVYVPRELLTTDPSKLDPDRLAQFERHHEAAHGLARGAGIPEQVCGWILRVRERFDGHGPEGLAADGIPIESRITRVACVCDLVLSNPAFASAGPAIGAGRQLVLDELRGGAGNVLDPRVLDAMVAVLDRAAQAEPSS
jgi:HD-GYP domain-containing protein (c-di-GMP phosphodiesterase class II)